MEVNKNWR